MNLFERLIEDFIQSIINDPETKRIPIGPNSADPTYWRWFVWPRNRFLNCYLHNFHHDDPEDLHDHRMINISFLLQGSYYDEHFLIKPTPGLPLPRTERTLVKEWHFRFRLPSSPHRVVLLRDADLKPIPSWSLFLGFPHWRNWGFWLQDGLGAYWVSHEEYVEDPDPLSEGYGRKKVR